MIDFKLVDAAYVEGLIGDKSIEVGTILLEAHFSSIDHPLTGDLPVFRHLPHAIQIHPSYLEAGRDVEKYYPAYTCPKDGNLLPDRQLIAFLEDLGITPDTRVVVYGSEPDGIMAAARLIWGLMYAGVKKIRLLDGGLNAWLANGSQTAPEIRKASDFPGLDTGRTGGDIGTWQIRREYLGTTAEVRKIVQAHGRGNGAKLVDVRRPDEYFGTETRYYPFFSKAGHIPHAILQGNWGNLVESDTGKLGPKLNDIRSRWKDLGIIDQEVEQGNTSLIFYCGTGWRSSLSFLAAILLGYRAKNYDDGFYGWSWDEGNEISYIEAPETAEDVVVAG